MVIHGKPRRFGIALAIAFVLAIALFAVKNAEAQVAINPCKGLTTSDAAYWIMGCYLVK